MSTQADNKRPYAGFRATAKNAFVALGRVMGALPRETPVSGADSASLQTVLLPHAATRWTGPRASQMTPDMIGYILAEAITGTSPRREQDLYDLMEETWPRLNKATQEIKNAVLGLEWNVVEPEGCDPRAAALLRRCQNGMKGDPARDGQGWRGTLSELLDAWTRGISVSEILWEQRGGSAPAILPRCTLGIPPWHFGWKTGANGQDTEVGATPDVNDGRLVLYPDIAGQDCMDFPPNKFLIAIRKARKGHPSRGALLRSLSWWWASANFSREWLLNFAQVFGQPFRWATYDASSPGAKADLAAMMAAMGSAAWGVGPEGSKVEFHEASKGGADNPQAYVLALADKACDLLLLGQTLTSDVGESGSRALGDVHQSVRSDIIDSAAVWLAEILNEQLATAVVALNLGDTGEDAALPFWEAGRKEQIDMKLRAETAKLWLDAGIQVPEDFLYEYLDIPAPQAGVEVVKTPEKDDPLAAAPEPDIRKAIAGMPVDAREYFMARLRQ